MNAGESFSGRPERHDRHSFLHSERREKKHPDGENGDETDGNDDEEPCQPAGLGSHMFQSDDVLGRGDRRRHPTNAGGKSDAENK